MSWQKHVLREEQEFDAEVFVEEVEAAAEDPQVRVARMLLRVPVLKQPAYRDFRLKLLCSLRNPTRIQQWGASPTTQYSPMMTMKIPQNVRVRCTSIKTVSKLSQPWKVLHSGLPLSRSPSVPPPIALLFI